MLQFTNEELIIIGRYHTLCSVREECMGDINRNHFSMSGIDLTCKGEAGRMLELLDAQTRLVHAFRDIGTEYQSALKSYRNVMSGKGGNNE